MQSLFQGLSKANPFTRKQIFSDYRLPDDPTTNQQRVPVSRDKKKNDQVLLRQLRLFKFNLTSVLDQKKELMRKLREFEEEIDNVHEFIAGFNQGQKDDSEQVKAKFRELCSGDMSSQLMNFMAKDIQESLSKGKSVLPVYFLKSMILYRVLLNIGKQLKYEAESFRLGTMSNLNPLTTKANFTKSPQDAEQTINLHIQKVKSQSSKAMESKVRQSNGWEKDRFLREDDKSRACWKGLEELNSAKQVELIHYEMLNVLNELDSVIDKFCQLLESHMVRYKKYEGLMDSIELMSRQMRQMRQTVLMKDELLRTLSTEPELYLPPTQLQRLIERESNQQVSIYKNIKIYHINQKLFANYNTETNLISYYQLRKNYSLALAELEKRMVLWRDELAVMKDMAGAYSQVDMLINKKAVAASNSSSKNRKYLTSASSTDNQIVRLVVNLEQIHTIKNAHLHQFKKTLLAQTNSRLTQQSPDIRLSQTHHQATTKDIEILQRQKSFFRGLVLMPQNSKKDYLIKNNNAIQEYIVFNNNIKHDRNVDRQRLNKYLWEFQLCQTIANVSDTLKKAFASELHCLSQLQIVHKQNQLAQNQLYFPQLITQHLTRLQKASTQTSLQDHPQLHQLIAHHTHDYQLFHQLFQSSSLKTYLNQLAHTRDANFSYPQKIKPIHELISLTHQLITLHFIKPLDQILDIFYESLFQTNHDLSFELFAFEHFFWQTLRYHVAVLYEESRLSFAQNLKQIRSFDPDDFFSIPCLVYMINSKAKVKNLQEIIVKIMKKLYNKVGNFQQDTLIEPIVCLSFFISYLQVAYQFEDRKEKVIVLNKLRRYLTVELMKLKYDKLYAQTIQLNKALPLKEIRIILGIERYLTIKDPSQKLDLKLEFSQNCLKYLDMFEKDIKPLTINVSSSFSSERTLSKLCNMFSFEEWPRDLELAISDQKLSPLNLLSYMSVLQYNLHELLKLAESPQVSAIKQSQGFLIRRIKKESFYVKKQLNKFILLAKQSIWESLDKTITECLSQLYNQRKISNRKSKSDTLEDLQLKIKKAMLNTDQKYS